MSTREEWLSLRRCYLTASDVAALLGESPWKTRDQLLREKAGALDVIEGDESMRLAELLEGGVAHCARELYGWELRPNGKALHVDPECPYHAATPDFYLESPWGLAVVDAKVTRALPRDKVPALTKSGKPTSHAFAHGAPLYYALQLQSQMACTGARHGVILALHTGPLALRAYHVPRHDGVIARIRAEVRAFKRELDALKAQISVSNPKL